MTPRGIVSDRIRDRLAPEQALEVDCQDIVSLFGAGVELPDFLKGFVVIETRSVGGGRLGAQSPLDVVAVYTFLSAMGEIDLGLDELQPFLPLTFLPSISEQTVPQQWTEDNLNRAIRGIGTGIGLGASIDVETIDARFLPFQVSADPIGG